MGNIRLSFSDLDNNGTIEPSSEILQERNYYPFGLEHEGYNSQINGVENNFMTYQGKELQKELDLNWHDFGARKYDPAIGRWVSVDPLAEERQGMSPYNFVQNNPLNRIDPTGMLDESVQGPDDWIKDRYGNYLWDDAAVDQSTTRQGWKYVGKELPAGVDDYQVLTEEGGQLYHKNTTNLPAKAFNYVNSLFGGDDDYLTEHKPYDPATENALSEGINTGASMVVGGLAAKGLGNGLNYLSRGASSSSSRGFGLLDDFASSYSKAAPGLTRAPKGGITIAGKYFKGGQFTPRPRLHFGRGHFSNFNTLPFGSSPIRPTPVNFSASPSLRWFGAIGGSSLSLWNSYNQMKK